MDNDRPPLTGIGGRVCGVPSTVCSIYSLFWTSTCGTQLLFGLWRLELSVARDAAEDEE